MATRPLSPSLRKARTAAGVGAFSARSVVLAAALPFLFLHVDWQPGFAVGLGSTSVGLELSDVAVLSVLVAALATGLRDGFAPLRRGLSLWLVAGALVAWIVVATLYGPAVLDGYPVAENLVTAAKLVEYALLAPAVVLLVRGEDDLRLPLAVLIGWSALATAVALVQFLGADIFDAWAQGRRQPSFLGHHDFAALSGAAFLAGLWQRRWLAIVAGGAGLILAAAVASLLGLALAVLALAVLLRPEPRRIGLTLGLSAVVAVGVLAIRGGDVADFLRFAGEEQPVRTDDVETYSHRTLLAYIGGRIWLDHPVVGVGWQGSSEPAAFAPYLADARRRFPDTAPLAFPSPERRHGVQNAYVQALADLGVIGLALLVGVFAAGLALAWRAAPSLAAVLGLLWLLLAAGLWTAQGLVTGIPLAALTWIALGLAAVPPSRHVES